MCRVLKQIHFQFIANKNKGWQNSCLCHNITWQNLSMARLASAFPFQIMLTKGEGQAVAPLSPLLWEPQHQHMLQELGPYGSQWRLLKHAQTHQDVSLFRQVLTLLITSWGDTSPSIVKTGGKVPRPPKLSYHRIIGWHMYQLSDSQESKRHKVVCKSANHGRHNVPPVWRDNL